jgi:hypothetical protein
LAATEHSKDFGWGRETAPDVINGSRRPRAFSVQILRVHEDPGLLVKKLGVGIVTGPTLWTLFKSTSQKTRKDLFGGREVTRRDSK